MGQTKISALTAVTKARSGDVVPVVTSAGTRKVDVNTFLPVGSYIQHAGPTAPTGFIACDGAAVSRTTYADLFDVIGTTYGAGNGSTTFNLPDARGLVMVGAGTHGTMTRANSTAYNGGSVGASRNDQMQGHHHVRRYGSSGGPYGTTVSEMVSGGTGSSENSWVRGNAMPGSYHIVAEPSTDGTNGTPRTGNETRPAEIAVLVCIKY